MVPNETPSELPRRLDATLAAEHPFRLSLARLFLWTGTTAVALLLLQPTFRYRVIIPLPLVVSPNMPDAEPAPAAYDRIVPALVATAVAPFYGAAILALGTAARMTIRGIGPLDVREPGHWILMMVGCLFLGCMPMVWIFTSDSDPDPRLSWSGVLGGLSLLASFVSFAATLLLVLFACLEVREPWRWKMTFRLLAATLASLVLGCLCAPAYMPFTVMPVPVFVILLLLFLLALASAAVLDLETGQRRDLAHWLGVAAAFVSVGHLVALAIIA